MSRAALMLLCALGLAQPVLAACPDTPFEGACDGAIVQWCEGGEPRSIDCEAHAACCGWSTASLGGSYGCVPCDACAAACDEGQRGCSIEGTHAWTCVAREGGCNDREWARCEQGCHEGTCGEPGETESPCPDTCEVGEAGCLDEARAYICEIPQTGACPRKTTTTCGEGEGCFEGTCEPVVKTPAPAEADGCRTGHGAPPLLLAALFALLAVTARRRRRN